jgi:phage-related minor tail protein
MADNFGLKIGVEGEKEFKKALSDINSTMKVLGSEMKLVESSFDKQDKSVQALTSRNEVLKCCPAAKAEKDQVRHPAERLGDHLSCRAVSL